MAGTSGGSNTATALEHIEGQFDVVIMHATAAARKDYETVTKQFGEMLHTSLRQCLHSPPAVTTVRVNTLKYQLHDAQSYILLQLHKEAEYGSRGDHIPTELLYHPDVPDMVALPLKGPRGDLIHQQKKIIVDSLCGNSVLRGADVYAPGVMGAPKGLEKGDYVSVYSDIDKKCLKGTAKDYEGTVKFLGNGQSLMSRDDLFGKTKHEKGCAVRMTHSLYFSPSLNEVEDMLFLQNLPSIVVSHVLDPKPGERILDMCAAPGGKTLHIATLMKDKGCLIALDKSAPKVQKLLNNVDRYHISCAKCFKFDATKALSVLEKEIDKDVPPFSPESFDRILVDAPCSALGQRPKSTFDHRLSDLKSYPHYQRMLLEEAIGLLKVGGTLVYSTCTYNPEENECQVKWLLEKYNNVVLADQRPFVGYSGLPGFGLDERETQKLQRFWPSQFIGILETYVPIIKGLHHTSPVLDTIAFFLAKFVKTSY